MSALCHLGWIPAWICSAGLSSVRGSLSVPALVPPCLLHPPGPVLISPAPQGLAGRQGSREPWPTGGGRLPGYTCPPPTWCPTVPSADDFHPPALRAPVTVVSKARLRYSELGPAAGVGLPPPPAAGPLPPASFRPVPAPLIDKQGLGLLLSRTAAFHLDFPRALGASSIDKPASPTSWSPPLPGLPGASAA